MGSKPKGKKAVPKAIAQARSGGHPGFKALVQAGVPPAAMAKASRNASPAAKAKNPNLKKVPVKKARKGRGK